MSQKSGPPPIVFILIFLFLAGAGLWWFVFKPKSDNVGGLGGGLNPSAPTLPNVPGSVPSGTTVRVDGSTSMVTINQSLKRGFETQFPGSTVTTQSNGSEKGIQDLLAGSADIAAVSRPLSSQEQGQGLVAQSIATDQIAVVVGKNNPFQGGLTSAQVSDIFQGKTNNWSLVGGAAGQIRVINRPAISGTHQAFKELVLKGGNFGTSPNIMMLPRDETTGLLQQLKTDGIGYATYTQVAKQQTVRVVPIDGILPGSPSYPFQRQLFYVYKNPPSPGVQAFLAYAVSPQGQQAMLAGN